MYFGLVLYELIRAAFYVMVLDIGYLACIDFHRGKRIQRVHTYLIFF